MNRGQPAFIATISIGTYQDVGFAITAIEGRSRSARSRVSNAAPYPSKESVSRVAVRVR